MTVVGMTAWRLALAVSALVAALSVYALARTNLPVLLEPLKVAGDSVFEQSALAGSAPSFFFTLSICLFLGACASTLAQGYWHGLAWIVLASMLEISQARVIAVPLVDGLTPLLPDAWLKFAGPYWIHGVFDPLDLVATLIGGVIALFILKWPTGK